MMSTRLSNNKSGRRILRLPKVHELFDLRYFLINLKLQWPLFMLFSIVFFFAIPVVIVFGMQNYSVSSWTPERIYSNLVETITSLCYFISACAAVFAAISVTRDLMKPSAAGFYAALPVRREANLLVRICAGLVNYIGGLAVGIVLGILATVAVGMAKNVVLLLPIIGTSFVVFLFLYTLIIACGMLCGTSITQFVMTALVLVLPPLTYYMFFLWMSEHIDSLWINWYTDINKLNVYFPGIRLLSVIFDGQNFSALDTVWFILLSFVLVVISLVLFRMRINERTGEAAAFRIVGPIVKYCSMVPAAIIGGMLFREISNSLPGTAGDILSWCFGWICAALLTFMLVNAVVHRSAKAVMHGIKWAPIFAGVFLVLNILIMGDAADIDGYIPNPNTLSKVEMRINNTKMTFESDEAIDAIVKIISRNEEKGGDYYEPEISRTEYIDNYENKGMKISASSNYFQLNAAFDLKFGPTVAKYYMGMNKAAIADALRELADTEEFRTQYKAIIEDFEDSEFYASLGLADGDRSFHGYYHGYADEFGIWHESDEVTIDSVTDEVNADYFARPQLGTLHLYGNSRSVEVPLFLDDALTGAVEAAADRMEELAKVTEMSSYSDGGKGKYGGVMTSENLEDFTGRYISHIGIVNTRTGEEYTVKKKSEICEIMANVQSVCYSNVSLFSIPSYDYYVILYMKDNSEIYYDAFLTYFIDGKIPQFISK